MAATRLLPILPFLFLCGCQPAPAPAPSPARSASLPEPGHELHTVLEANSTDPRPLPATLLFASNYRSPDFNLYVKPLRGLPVSPLCEEPSDEREPALHPDGTTLAFASNASGNWDIYRAPLDTAPRSSWIPLAATPDFETHPSWAPDGRLAWCAWSVAKAEWRVRVLYRDSSDTAEICEGFSPEWDPSGEWIVCQRARRTADRWSGLWIVEAKTGKARELIPSPRSGAVTPSWSPDGKWIVYASSSAGLEEEPQPEDLWAVSIDGTRHVRLTSGTASEWNPRFGPDGRIYYCRRESENVEIWSMPSPLK